MIQNRVARRDIAQKIDKRDLIALRARERAHNEVEIGGGKPRPTIRPDHRDFIMRKTRSRGKSDVFNHRLHGLKQMNQKTQQLERQVRIRRTPRRFSTNVNSENTVRVTGTLE